MAREYNFTGSGAITSGTVLIGPIDADGMLGMSLQVASIGASGGLTVQQSNDGVTWQTGLLHNTTGSNSSTLNNVGVFWVNLVGRYVRVTVQTSITSGNTVLNARLTQHKLSELPSSLTGLNVSVLPATPSGTNVMGSVTNILNASAGMGTQWLYHRLVQSAAGTNAASVKTSASRVGKIYGYNAAASGRFLKLYNKNSAPVVGTDVPVLTIALKAQDVFNIDVSALGIWFSVGLAYAITGGVTDADTTPVAANDVVGLNIVYI